METNTENKGDILAARIETFIEANSLYIPTTLENLREALAEYRKPLPAVEKWAAEKQAFREGKAIQWKYPNHNRDWLDCTESVLPHWFADFEYRVKPIDPYAELKQAHAEGRVIQMSHQERGKTLWTDFPDAEFGAPPGRYRVKPEPVPIGPEDVKCGDRLKQSHFKPGVEFQIIAVLKDGIGKFVHENDEFRVDLILWSELKSDWLISRDGGKTWAKCEKPEGGK